MNPTARVHMNPTQGSQQRVHMNPFSGFIIGQAFASARKFWGVLGSDAGQGVGRREMGDVAGMNKEKIAPKLID